MSKLKVKICGLTSAKDIEVASTAGADMLGFVFFKPSPRSVCIDQARYLMDLVPPGVLKVALSVNGSDKLFEKIFKNTSVDLFQFHGSESPERINTIKNRFNLKIIKALPISSTPDVDASKVFEPYADYLMFDAKPIQGSSRPGGNAQSFDWRLVKDFSCSIPWILAGGLNPTNLKRAIKTSGANFVDVSSGVEISPGVKDPEKIKTFLKMAKQV